jgi:NitT/TauT family transport system substrate-binding protein
MPETLTIEASGAVFSLPYFVAAEEGYFEEEGLNVELARTRKRPTGPADLVSDHTAISSFGSFSGFESGEVSVYRACEWGQIRRSYDSARQGRVVSKRAAVASQAIFTRADSGLVIPQDLAGRTVAVNFHHGSHYLAIQTLEGFLGKDEINVVHAGSPQQRFEALRDGRVDAAALMEPWITVATKLGFTLVAEAHYVGSEIAGPDVSAETFAAINRAVSKGVHKINEDIKPYLHYFVEEVPPEIGVTVTAEDFEINRLRFVDPAPYPERDFQRTYDWMVGWELIAPDATFEDLVDNRVAATTG